jgi:hypothetical protein
MKKALFMLFAVAVTLSCTTINKIFSPKTPTPTPTETPALSSELAGNWNLHYDWGCGGSYRSTAWILFENGTFRSVETENTGTWTAVGNHFHLQYNGNSPAVYEGTISGNHQHMEGTMEHPSAGHGCWYADKQ